MSIKENLRLIALVKRERKDEGTVWDITLDGVDTGVYIVQEMMDNIHASAMVLQSVVDKTVEVFAEQLSAAGYPITKTEKQRFNKLLQCMT